MQLLVTGATGKVGVNLIERLLADPRWPMARVRALCHNRTIQEADRVEVVKGSIDDRGCVDRAVRGVTHVVHLATCKEIPETVMDVTVKGLFWLLEAFRGIGCVAMSSTAASRSTRIWSICRHPTRTSWRSTPAPAR